MAGHHLNSNTSQVKKSGIATFLGAKRLSLILFSHMLLLSLIQTVTHIIAPAAKPPAIPIAKTISKKANSIGRKRFCLEESSANEIMDNQVEGLLSDTITNSEQTAATSQWHQDEFLD